MLATTILLSLLVAAECILLAAWAFCLRGGLRWVAARHITFLRVGAISVAMPVLRIALAAGASLFDWPPRVAGVVNAGILLLSVLATCLIITWAFKLRLLQAVQAWTPTLIAQTGAYLLALLFIQPFVCKAFLITGNAMAPTLLGAHWRGPCPQCNEPCYGTPARFRTHMVCRQFHTSQINIHDMIRTRGNTIHGADRVLVARWLVPERWDVVVFRLPEDPSRTFAMRLVGMPGEEIRIHDGTIWADGVQLAPPESLQNITYSADPPGVTGLDLWETADQVATLADDEFFVLGDFPSTARDSRLWQTGAPGHNPFAVPRSHLVGVVANVYWPVQRWHIFR